jgi:hypothetical protein
MIQVKFINFWEDFGDKDNYITYLLRINNINYKVVEDNIDYLFVGCFIHTEHELNIIKSYPSKIIKILFITEPIEKFYPYAFRLFNENIFDYIFGSIYNKFDNNKQIYYKLPFYIMYYDYKNANIYNDINNFILNQDISSKKNICLINSHDRHNSRTSIYNSLVSKGLHIICPGKLFNNASNEELNSIGKQEYLKRFIFNICPENTKTVPNGYITEKLLECCKSGCIPIYCGSFDDIDEKIFNKDRIIFFDYESEESINNCSSKIIEFLNDKEKLEKFYKQPSFVDTAYNTLMELENKFFNIFR